MILNKSNVIDFVTFFDSITLPITLKKGQLHYQMQLVMLLISITFQLLKKHHTSLIGMLWLGSETTSTSGKLATVYLLND